MKIESVKIQNYRSLGETQNIIRFDHNIIALVGKNESGKSNILNAINSIKFFDNIDANPFNQVNKQVFHPIEISSVVELDDKDLTKLLAKSQNLERPKNLKSKITFYQRTGNEIRQEFDGFFHDILNDDSNLTKVSKELIEKLNNTAIAQNVADYSNIVDALKNYSKYYIIKSERLIQFLQSQNNSSPYKECLSTYNQFIEAISKYYNCFALSCQW